MYCGTEKMESDVEVHGEYGETATTLYEGLGMNRSVVDDAGLLPTIPVYPSTTTVSKVSMMNRE